MATCSKNDKLEKRVNYVLDEFSNLPKIENFENRISEARSKNIRYFLCLQSFNQLTAKYKDNAETIISNCNNWICYSSKEMDFLNKIAELCSKEVDYNGREHYLLNPFSMQHLRKEIDHVQVVLIKQGLYPYVSELIDYEYIPGFPKEKKTLKKSRDIEQPRKETTASLWFDKVAHSELSSPFPKYEEKKRAKSKYKMYDFLD